MGLTQKPLDKVDKSAYRLWIMVDKSALFTEVTKRNALRREAGLPMLDVRKEVEHQAALIAEREVNALTLLHPDDRSIIEAQVIADLRAQRGADFIYTMAGRWTINAETEKRFRAHLRDVYQIIVDEPQPRHPVPYA